MKEKKRINEKKKNEIHLSGKKQKKKAIKSYFGVRSKLYCGKINK